jgi:hypothetical protein
LSPIGGQASLRLLDESPRTIFYNTTVRHLPIEIAEDTYMEGADAVVEGWPSYGPTFMTALKTTRKLQNSSLDLFGNIKIPVLSELNSAVNGSWAIVDHNKEVPYSSLLGIPVAGIPADGNSSFQVLSRYWTVNCPKLIYIPDFGTNKIYNTSNSALSRSASSFSIQSTGTVAPDHASFNLTSSSDEESGAVSVAYCDLALQDVQSAVSCQGQNW